MSQTYIVVTVLILTACLAISVWFSRRRKRIFLESHSINPEQLHAILFAPSQTGQSTPVQVIDVRQPLDLLAYSEIIPGSRRIPPKEILGNPDLLPKDQDIVVYCTCPSDETSGKIMRKAVALGFQRVKVLHGGLDAWKQKSYPVEPYESAFHLDTPV